jgi:hypothetical protein
LTLRAVLERDPSNPTEVQVRVEPVINEADRFGFCASRIVEQVDKWSQGIDASQIPDAATSGSRSSRYRSFILAGRSPSSSDSTRELTKVFMEPLTHHQLGLVCDWCHGRTVQKSL